MSDPTNTPPSPRPAGSDRLSGLDRLAGAARDAERTGRATASTGIASTGISSNSATATGVGGADPLPSARALIAGVRSSLPPGMGERGAASANAAIMQASALLSRIRMPKFRFRPRLGTVRVLPVTLLAVLFMFTLKVNDLWFGIVQFSSAVAITPAQAQQEPAKGAPAAQASAAQPPAGTAGKPAAAGAAGTAVASAEMPRDPTRFSQSEIDLLQALSARRDLLEKRQKDLDQRESTVRAAESRLAAKITELDTLKQQLQGMVTQQNDQEDQRLRSLVRIYEAMKPKDAAQIFDKLEYPVLIGVVERMKEAKVAPILAAMEPDRAKTVTSMLADRKDIPRDASRTQQPAR